MAETIVDEVTRQLTEFENAWNRGDLEAVIRYYHPSVYVMVGLERWSYDKEVAYLKGLMTGKDRGRLRFEVDFTRSLGPNHTLVNGSFHLTAADGTEQGGPFTAVWMREANGWQCIYSHS